MCALGIIRGDIMGFFLILFMVCMMLLRWRVPKTGVSGVVDVLACVIFGPVYLGIALFAAMYYGMYFVILAAVYVLFAVDLYLGIIAILCGGLGLLLKFWEDEWEKRMQLRDEEAGRYYELESLQGELLTATAQVERMTAISERARISREIHDNAGHEIVAAFISLQTVRHLFEGTDPEILKLYDDALSRLDAGANKIREAVHNLSTVTALGVEALREICERFPKAVTFSVFGDTRHVPMYAWNVLESCLNEGLTNIGKHANPRQISVQIDVTPHIVRLCIENDGGDQYKKGIGTGLRNLRHRLTAVGGSIAVAHGETFRLVCVVPISTPK